MNRAYKNCALKFGEAIDPTRSKQEFDGKDQLKLYQYFRKEDGVYMQYFANKTSNIAWKHFVAFNLYNMSIIGYRTKNKRIDVEMYPGDEQLILICQSGGQNYNLSGGEGTCTFTPIAKKFLNRKKNDLEDPSDTESDGK